MLDHRVPVAPNQFRVVPAQRKPAGIRRHRSDVVVGFAGSVDHTDKRVTLNKSLWCAILRFAGHEPDKVFFDRSDSKHTAIVLEVGVPPGFEGDEEATAKLRDVLTMFSQGRPISVIGERLV